MTNDSPATPRGVWSPGDDYDTIRVDLLDETYYARYCEALLNGDEVGTVHSVRRNPHILVIGASVRRGEVGLTWKTPWGTWPDAELPDWVRPFCEARNPFRQRPAPYTTVEARRERVRVWARANTTTRQSLRFVFHGKPPGPAATLDSKKRSSGEIWWAFVLMTVCASLEDEWLEDDLVWPAIERNIELTAEEFCGPSGGVNLNTWANPAAYMAALSRIYKAGPELTDEPLQVNVAYPDGPLSRLHANSDGAKDILYGVR